MKKNDLVGGASCPEQNIFGAGRPSYRLNEMPKSVKTVLALLVLLVLLGPLLAPYSPFVSNLEETLQAPNALHWLGTDANGKDILSLILTGARLSLLISAVVVSICLTGGIVFGFLAAYLGGTVDRIFLFFADIFQAFPGMLLAIAIAAFIPPSVLNLILVLSFVGWVSYARVVRAQTLELKSKEFILAGRALGVSHLRLLLRHFLPNMAGPLVVQSSFGMAGVILAESSLSFLGLGLPPQTPSLGRLMDSGIGLLLVAPHVSISPGAVIMLFVLSFSLIGDMLRRRLAV